jgi:hypothetical protein
MARMGGGRPRPTKTIKRLIVSEHTEDELDEVIEALREGRSFVYWGNNQGYEADFLFVHRRGMKDVLGVLKVLGRTAVPRELITETEFAQHRPSAWGTRLTDFERFYRITAARRVDFLFDELLNRKGFPLDSRGMHDMVFVDCHRFEMF